MDDYVAIINAIRKDQLERPPRRVVVPKTCTAINVVFDVVDETNQPDASI